MDVLDKALRRESLSSAEANSLWSVPLGELADAADRVRREVVSDADVVTWQIDRNVNITNVCVSGCRFCNFHCRPSESERAYILDIEDYIPRVEEMLELGGDQLLLQGGLHPRLGIEFYERLFAELKRLYPRVKIHALGPPEISHIARLSGLSTRETLERLVSAGLDSLPGAGAEILSDRVRNLISPGKPSSDQWLRVMREAHAINLPTSATMMYGHIETTAEITEHLIKIRDTQAQKPESSHGFVAFIPWIFRGAGTRMEKDMRRFSPLEYLRVIAVSRLVLNNITNIQASWLTVGTPTAQMALHGGANDMGSIMIEERVVASAGATNSFDAEGIQRAILDAGFRPRLRDQLYRLRENIAIS